VGVLVGMIVIAMLVLVIPVIVIVIVIVVVVIVIVVAHGQPRRRARRIRDAAKAAPNPLSMFTTVIPDAHEVSIPRSAESP
jgi:uncharacterized membrane protein